MNYIILASCLLLLPTTFFCFKRFVKWDTKWFFRGVSLLLAIVFFIRYLSSPGSLFKGCLRLAYNAPFSSSFLTFIVLMLVWFSFAVVVILQLLPFFRFNILKNLAKTFCLIVSTLNLGFLQQTIYTFTGTYKITLCGAFLAVEVAITFLYSLYMFITEKFFVIPKKELVEYFVGIFIAIFFAVPPYLLSALFGNVNGVVKSFELNHRLYIYATFIILFGLYFLFRKRDKEYSRMALLYISLVTLIAYTYEYKFSIFITPHSWPLHLCNTAMFIVPICLIFRLDKLFYFTLFINVLGAFLAIFMPNYSETFGLFSPEVVRFWINHIMAFIMPALIVFLGVYRRPKLKLFIYSMIGFLLYFLLVLVLNAYFTSAGKPTDFFFINSDFVADKLGEWAENTRNITGTIKIGSKKLIFYPLYQSLFFLVYVFLGFAMWFLYAFLFQVQDFYKVLGEKRRKIKLDEIALSMQYGNENWEECMNEKSVNKLVVKNVSKRYGNNKNYSVKDVSFEVKAGEILGFLGPNGAGKSTMIKCIVGIQPPTSGSIEINGYDIVKQPVNAKKQFGFVPDHYALYEKLTGREYINYIADLYGVSKEDRDKRMEKLLTNLSMGPNIDNPIRTYSHGMKQKITIMCALIYNPKLWILDEPLTGLDPNSIYEVKECMKQHAKEKNIVFFSSHIIDIVEKLCDRIIIIKKGNIEASITMKELKKKKISLEKYYLDLINGKDEEPKDMTFTEEEVKEEENLGKFFEDKEKKKNDKKNKEKQVKKKKKAGENE